MFSIAFQLSLTLILAEAVQRPHIVYFFVDDLGWNDVGFHGLTDIPTPNINALAYNGVILNNYYTHYLCSPSRGALLSSMVSTSTGLQRDVIHSRQPAGLPLNLKILPEFLNDLGYETHIVGKWHLGFHTKSYTPLRRGFKTHYGMWSALSDHFSHISTEIYSRDMIDGVPSTDTRQNFTFSGNNFRDDSKGFDEAGKYITDVFTVAKESGKYLTEMFTDRSVDIIRNHDKKKPLFLYLAHHGVHRGDFTKPIRGPERYVRLFTNLADDPRRRNFAGALTAIDTSLGDVMEALEKTGMIENTVVVFSTDNGAPLPGDFFDNGGSNYPLRGGKYTVWEGGMRVSAFVWDGRQGRRSFVYNGLMHIVDWLPTLYAAAGGKENIIKTYKLHGLNLWKTIKENRASPRKNVLLQSDLDVMAYRSGQYKIVSGETVPTEREVTPGRGPPPPGVPSFRCKTVEALIRTYGHSVVINGKPIEVKCGTPSRVPCEPAQATCLFNVVKDPCEIRNLANKMPTMLRRLKREMDLLPVVRPNYPKRDYISNPDFFCGYWTTWLDNPSCPKTLFQYTEQTDIPSM